VSDYQRWVALSCLVASLLGTAANATELRPETVAAFDRYIQATEERMAEDLRHGRFLVPDELPDGARQQAYSQLRQGQFHIEPLRTKEDGKLIPVPAGIVHHWVGIAFIPGAAISQTLAVLQDYDDHKTIYKPDVRESKLLGQEGNEFKVYLQFCGKSLVTVVVNGTFDIHYTLLGTSRASSKSYSTRIAEVENAGKPDERELPVGNDHGYLWRLYSYWRIEEKDGGVYIQVESIALSRTIPWEIAWLVNPLVRSIPSSVLFRLLDSTRRAVQSRGGASRSFSIQAVASSSLNQLASLPLCAPGKRFSIWAAKSTSYLAVNLEALARGVSLCIECAHLSIDELLSPTSARLEDTFLKTHSESPTHRARGSLRASRHSVHKLAADLTS